MKSIKKERIAVLGAGSWGATLAVHLAHKGHDVSLWEFDRKAAESLAKTRRLKILPELQVPRSIKVTNNLAEALVERPIILSATPSHTVAATMTAARKTRRVMKGAAVISVSKGLEEKTLRRMSQIITDSLHIPSSRVIALSGPSHAEEVCLKMVTTVVAAGTDAALVRRVQKMFEEDFFRVYPHSDLIGVELGGTLKNIFAIAVGIADGLGMGDNARAAILTRGLNEMTRVGVKMGGNILTFFGLTGMGDLIVTCLSKHSRNRSLGEKIGQGKSVQKALSEMTMVTEGMKAAPAAWRLVQKLKLDCPLTQEIYKILYEQKNPKRSIHDLMSRETQSEWQGIKARDL